MKTTMGTRWTPLMNSMAAAARQRLMRGSVVNISFRLPHVSMRLMARRQKTKFTAPVNCQNWLQGCPAQGRHTKAGAEAHGTQFVTDRVDKEGICYLSVSPICSVRKSLHTRIEGEDVDCVPVISTVTEFISG